MTTTLADELAQRRAVVNDTPDLRHLAERLRRLAAPLREGDLYLPDHKPLLSRDGGACPTDGARLEFDPRSPEGHRCPACHRVYRGERHHRDWIWRYHLWLSERAVHLALLGALLDDPSLTSRAALILDRYARLYPTVPNKDNVLGPTRLFFSTYLESIWLTQIVIAALVVEQHSAPSAQRPAPNPLRRLLDPMIDESARLIASFNEGLSNRQVWNATAQLAAGLWLTDDALYEAG